MPRYRVSVPGELRTFGDFLRDYREESSFAERADVRAHQRTFRQFNEWLASQPGDRFDDLATSVVGPRDPNSLIARSSFFRPSHALTTADPDLGQASAWPQAFPSRNAVDPLEPRADNRVARNLRVAAKASAADGRMYDPNNSVRSIYGTMFDPSIHTRFQNPVSLRRMKRREVLFARGRIGERYTRSNRASRRSR